MKSTSSILSVATIVFLAGCVNTGADYAPIPDGPQNAAYASDLESCRLVATRREYLNGDTRTDALIGAGIGALAGLADDSASDAQGAAVGAIVGGLVGGGAGVRKTLDQRREIVVECMKGRGHSVVG